MGVGFSRERSTSLLTNTDSKNRGLYELALSTYRDNGGKLRIYIKDDAYYKNGIKMDGLIAIHTADREKDHGEFWRIYESVEKSMKQINMNIDHKTLAKHFKKTNEAMRQLKRKYEADKTGLWPVYVKAYNWDTRK